MLIVVEHKPLVIPTFLYKRFILVAMIVCDKGFGFLVILTFWVAGKTFVMPHSHEFNSFLQFVIM